MHSGWIKIGDITFYLIEGHLTVSSNAPSNPSAGHEAQDFQTWMCLICGWVYDEADGLPEEGIAAGTRWADVPMNWTCPECGARKEDFEMVAI